MLIYILMSLILGTSLIAKQPDLTPQDAYDRELYHWTRTLSEAFDAVKKKYYTKNLDPKDAILKAISAFVSIDPHSSFLDPKAYEEILKATSGEFFGIGVIISNKNPDEEFLAVIDTLPEGPAEKAGLRAGDKIIQVDATALRGISADEATAKLKGERHSKVQVKVLREGYPEPLVFDITRDVVKEKNSLCYFFKDHNVYYLHLNMFTQNAFNQLTSLLKKAQKQQCKGIIIDLRNNSGGLLTSAVDISGLFVPKGSLIVTTKDRDNKVTDEYRTNKEPIMDGSSIPIFILINNFTASAAEILAGCLKVYSEKLNDGTKSAKGALANGSTKKVNETPEKKSFLSKVLQPKKEKPRLPVFLVGNRTFGKGSVQEVIPVSNDCAIKLTTALYFLPNDETIQGVGIQPDIEFERKFPPPAQVQWVSQFYGRESALKGSIKTPGQKDEKKKQNKKGEKENWKEKRKEAIASDSQIHDTITCINILSAMPQAWHTRADAIKLLKSTIASGDGLNMVEVE